jgi:hypothetical protein
MPLLYFPSGSLATTTTAPNITTLKIRRNIGRPGLLATKSVASAGKITRKRSIQLEPSKLSSSLEGILKRKLKLGPAVIRSTTQANVKFFIAANPAPPPKGNLYLADITAWADGSTPPAFNGQRIIRGDLIPLTFKITGQRLSSLNMEFTAKRLDTGALIVKTNARVTDPVIDNKKIETVLGTFTLDPGDTSGFPDSEVELVYVLKFLDGLGRTYTIEHGNFTVFSIL